MVFSSITFLFFYLPLVLVAYYLSPSRGRNALLLLASLLFYAWSDAANVSLLASCILFNWVIGLWLERAKRGRLGVLAAGVVVNLGLLAYYKYYGFLFGVRVDAASIPALPIGISFFTFHAISYVVDVYRRGAAPFRRPWDLGLYIALFPQLVAGPIVRFHEIADQLRKRTLRLDRFVSGSERFIFGLSKKVLIADPVGRVTDHVFALPAGDLTFGIAWYGVLCYTIQIYFDFSGYSDMAIGLARLFGFEFPENFNYPYVAVSIKEFWRRWHLTLSAWFRDYLFIPLGGSRTSGWRTYLNLLLVFFLCGLWHGAAWNFAIWGLFHGYFLVLERGLWGRLLERAPSWIRHAYVALVVMVAWVWFRAESAPQAWAILQAMAGFGRGNGYANGIAALYAPAIWVPLCAGIFLSTPVLARLARDFRERRYPIAANQLAIGTERPYLFWLRPALCLALFVASSAFLAAETYHPFIYFRF